MNISIISGWVPIVGYCLAVAALVAAIDWRSGDWRRELGFGIPIAVVVTGVVGLISAVTSWLPSNALWPTYVWGFTFVLSIVVIVLGWEGAGSWRRAAMVGAVILTLVVTLDAVDQESGSFPTLSRLVTLDAENVVETPQLHLIREQVDRTGKLPQQGVVISEVIPSTVSHFSTRTAYVYLPPAWFAKVTPSLPTLILLPGEPGSASDWSGGGDADNSADAFAKTHHGLAPIIVMPDPNGLATDDTECVNSKFGNAETYLVDDVPAFARSRFNASRAPGSLAIGGLSAGGTCSVMLALRHPSVYPTFASFSGFATPQFEDASMDQTIDTLFAGSKQAFAAHDPVEILQGAHFEGMAGWFEVGDQDAAPLRAAHILQPAALKAGIATCIRVRPGGHDYDLWSQALDDAFPWLAWRLGLTPEPRTEPATCTTP